MKTNLLTLGLGILLLGSCRHLPKEAQNDLIADDVQFAQKQIGRQVEIIEASGSILDPRTIKNDKIQYVGIEDWTSGFFPGSMWYMYELTGDEKWKTLGVKYTEHLDSAKYLTWHHDVGFIINSSYGNAYKVTKDENYKAVIIEAAKSLSTRFRPTPGVIQS